MTNLAAFNPSHIQDLLKPFAPGMDRHVTPIKYEALTPDIYVFLFRTRGKDSSDHFFVALEFDYLKNLAEASALIEKWHGCRIIRFWSPGGANVVSNPSLDELWAESSPPYHSLLAEVGRPNGAGYWASNITILPGDSITNKIGQFSLQQQANIRRALERILKRDPEDNSNDINTTEIAVSIYVNQAGGIEFFYK